MLGSFGIGALKGAFAYMPYAEAMTMNPECLGLGDIAKEAFANTASSFLPSYSSGPFTLSPNFSLSSTGINFGVDLSVTGRVGNVVIGANVGGGIGSGMPVSGDYSKVGAFVGWTDGKRGAMLSSTYFEGNNSAFNQVVNGVHVGGESWGLQWLNDFPFSDKGRTNTIDVRIGNFSVGTEIFTNDIGNTRVAPTEEYDDPKHGKNEARAYKNGKVYFSSLYFGVAGGNRTVHQFGINQPWIQGWVQNGWHKLIGAPYFKRGDYGSLYYGYRSRNKFYY